MKLYSYCIPIDKGDAPNPFWGVCTLAICKPAIRRSAEKGDWIVATGSTKFGFQNRVIYAMEVTDKMTFAEYDDYCRKSLPEKIPDWNSKDLRRKAGDCIYNFEIGARPTIRKSVHTETNRDTDIGGRNVLLSDHFYYFGAIPVDLPTFLLQIVLQGQGHKSTSNEKYAEKFVKWIETFVENRNKITCDPFLLHQLSDDSCISQCSNEQKEYDLEDEVIGESLC